MPSLSQLIVWIAVGLIGGTLAGLLIKWDRKGFGVVRNLGLGLVGAFVGGLLFRLFDQIKPWPARAAEKLPGGWGVMLDDIVAGAWGAAVVIGAHALGWL